MAGYEDLVDMVYLVVKAAECEADDEDEEKQFGISEFVSSYVDDVMSIRHDGDIIGFLIAGSKDDVHFTIDTTTGRMACVADGTRAECINRRIGAQFGDYYWGLMETEGEDF